MFALDLCAYFSLVFFFPPAVSGHSSCLLTQKPCWRRKETHLRLRAKKPKPDQNAEWRKLMDKKRLLLLLLLLDKHLTDGEKCLLSKNCMCTRVQNGKPVSLATWVCKQCADEWSGWCDYLKCLLLRPSMKWGGPSPWQSHSTEIKM